MSKNSSKNTMREVLAFLFRHWRREKWLVVWVALCMIMATTADLLMPVYAGKLVDAIAMHAAQRSLALRGALGAIGMMALLGAVVVWGVWTLSSTAIGALLPSEWQARGASLRVAAIAACALARTSALVSPWFSRRSECPNPGRSIATRWVRSASRDHVCA